MGETSVQPQRRANVERVAAGLIIFAAAATVLGITPPEGMGMVPLIGGVMLLLLSNLYREPLMGGCLMLLMLTLRITLRGDDRYLPEEITLPDYLMMMLAAAATFRTSRHFWNDFQTLFATVIPLSGTWVWMDHVLRHTSQPFVAGTLTTPQVTLLFGLSLCYGAARLIAGPLQGRRGHSVRPSWPRTGWGLLTLLNAGLMVASGGASGLLLVGIALFTAHLSRWSRRQDIPWPASLSVCLIVAVLFLAGSAAALLLGPGASTITGGGELQQRLSLLGCFFHAPFIRVENMLLGVGFTNSSSWLCQAVHPGDQMMIHADNLMAQLAADNGLITLLAVASLIVWLAAKGWRLSENLANSVVLASLSAAVFTLLELQIGSVWAQSVLVQVLVGMQAAALSMPLEES